MVFTKYEEGVKKVVKKGKPNPLSGACRMEIAILKIMKNRN